MTGGRPYQPAAPAGQQRDSLTGHDDNHRRDRVIRTERGVRVPRPRRRSDPGLFASAQSFINASGFRNGAVGLRDDLGSPLGTLRSV